MKKGIVWLLALLVLAGTLTACSSQKEEKDVDLSAFYGDLAERYEWGETYMTDITGESLETYYPGLADIPTKQLVAKMPLMTSVVNEIVLMECETEDDAAEAAAILQDRIDTQAEGGAFYPESMEAWGRGVVVQQGSYVAMIASAEHQDEIVDAFNTLFA